MNYVETKLKGAFIIEPQPIHDNRGFFAYLFDAHEAASHGLATQLAQVKLSYNDRKGTVRGMHYQAAPALESKLVRCIRGAVYDIIVDMRPDSPTYLQHIGVELNTDNRRALYVPPLFAHGYQTLCDECEVVYQVDTFYAPEHERGVRYDDPLLRLRWPIAVNAVSRKDQTWPLLSTEAAAAHAQPKG
jgi:dTDP-4-dehydrorhamnose 3,5-epimerase